MEDVSDTATATEALIARAAAGDGAAWRELFEVLLPGVERRVRGSRSFFGFRRDEDAVREVVLAVFERLRRDDCRALRRYGDWRVRNLDRGFDDWLTIVTTNVIRDYVSGQLVTAADGASPRRLAEAEALPEEPAPTGRRRMGSATMTSVNELATAASAKLTPEQLAALHGWLQGYEYDELAARQALPSGREAERLVRAALARLRRHVEG